MGNFGPPTYLQSSTWFLNDPIGIYIEGFEIFRSLPLYGLFLLHPHLLIVTLTLNSQNLMYKCYFSTRAHYLIFFFQKKVFFHQLIQQIQFFIEKYLPLFQILRDSRTLLQNLRGSVEPLEPC